MPGQERSGHISIFDWAMPMIREEVAASKRKMQAGVQVDEIQDRAAQEVSAAKTEAKAYLDMVREDVVGQLTTAELLTQLGGRIAASHERMVLLQEQFIARMGSHEPNTNGHANGHTNGHVGLRIKKFHICVVGPLSSQGNFIQDACKLDERFFKWTIIYGDKIGQTVPNADVVIMWTKFGNHPMDGKLDKASDRLIRVDGKKGLSFIADLIRTNVQWLSIYLSRTT